MIKIKTFIFRILQGFLRFFQILRNRIKNLLRRQPNIFLIGSPEHGNMGDQLIALGELHWFQTYYPHTPVREFTHDTLLRDRKCRLLLSCIRKQDVLFLHGGGNVNDRYVNCERIRRRVVQKCPENRIVLFQQSIHFRDTPEAQQYKADTIRIYNQHKHLLILTREDTSFSLAKEMFPSLRVKKFPDMATCLFPVMKPSADFPRDGILLCVRADGERYFSEQTWQQLLSALQDYTVQRTDTHVRRVVPPAVRRTEAQALVDAFAHAKVIITDRFHGVIFSVLAQTPCIALRSCDHKIIDGVKWFRDHPGVLYAESAQEVPALVEKAMTLGRVPAPDFSHYFGELYTLTETGEHNG